MNLEEEMALVDRYRAEIDDVRISHVVVAVVFSLNSWSLK
jgi:hypothetical protein